MADSKISAWHQLLVVRQEQGSSEVLTIRGLADTACSHCPPAVPPQPLIKGAAGRDRISSVGSVWARCPQRRGFDPPLGTFSGRGDFSLGVNMGSNSILPETLSDESINRGLVCAHVHFIARTPKILTFMS